jgi:hypothetical protein
MSCHLILGFQKYVSFRIILSYCITKSGIFSMPLSVFLCIQIFLVALFFQRRYIRGYIQKFPDWSPGARTANGTALSDTRCSCIAILWVSLVSFAAITLRIISQQVFIVVRVYFVIDSVRKFLDTPSYVLFEHRKVMFEGEARIWNAKDMKLTWEWRQMRTSFCTSERSYNDDLHGNFTDWKIE